MIENECFYLFYIFIYMFYIFRIISQHFYGQNHCINMINICSACVVRRREVGGEAVQCCSSPLVALCHTGNEADSWRMLISVSAYQQ